MGGMFTLLKVRKDQKPGDYRDPGWFRHPAGTVAREYTGELPAASRQPARAARRTSPPVDVRKPPDGQHGEH
jgi:hypothetical protein